MYISNNILLTSTSLVTDQTKSLSNNELKLFSLGPKVMMTQKLDDKLLLDIEANFCRTAYQLKWLSKIQDDSNTTTSTNTNTFPIYTLNQPIHQSPANKELDSKLSRFKRSMFSILRKHKRIQQNLSSTQHTQSTMRNKKLTSTLR